MLCSLAPDPCSRVNAGLFNSPFTEEIFLRLPQLLACLHVEPQESLLGFSSTPRVEELQKLVIEAFPSFLDWEHFMAQLAGQGEKHAINRRQGETGSRMQVSSHGIAESWEVQVTRGTYRFKTKLPSTPKCSQTLLVQMTNCEPTICGSDGPTK